MEDCRFRRLRRLIIGFGLATPIAITAQTAAIQPKNPSSFSIPAQPLADALQALSRQAHLSIRSLPTASLAGKQSHAVTAQATAGQALEQLLLGTGLTGHVVGHELVVIDAGSSKTGSDSGGQRSAGVKELRKITVLGSMIPRTEIETASPLTVITAQDIKDRGYSSVADALQHSSINTGTVSHNGLRNVSLFGLDSSYTKVLVDGRPMPNYSVPQFSTAGSGELVANLGSIPLDMVERIEILPGSQSSLYGSDAIAGVVNVVLKKHSDYASFDSSYGWYKEGGGVTRKISMSDSFDTAKLKLTLGAQFNQTQAMSTDGRARRHLGDEWLQNLATNGYVVRLDNAERNYFLDPGWCGHLSRLWSSTVTYDVGHGCITPYASTLHQPLISDDESSSVSARLSYQITPDFQLYGDVLYSYERLRITDQAEAAIDIYDPNLQDTLWITRLFAPEEQPANRRLSEVTRENTYSMTLGGGGRWGDAWGYDVALTIGGESMDSRRREFFLPDDSRSYFTKILGPRLGTNNIDPVYEPNYALLYQPVSPSQFAAFTDQINRSNATGEDQLRAQWTNSTLFALPGGDAGLAVITEGGRESWRQIPASATRVAGLGTPDSPARVGRNHAAAATEWTLPLSKLLTIDASSRYDRYSMSQGAFGHLTYSLGAEFRPNASVLLRGKYGTGFKAPSLLDYFEPSSDYFAYVDEYVGCKNDGSRGDVHDEDCNSTELRQVPAQYVASVNLKPTISKAWSYGVVWSPNDLLVASVDYQHLNITNEIRQEDPATLSNQEMLCRTHAIDIHSPTCTEALAEVIRTPITSGSGLLGPIKAVHVRKINVADESNNSIMASAKYTKPIGAYGQLVFQGSYANVLGHRQRLFPGEPVNDLLRAPAFSSEYKTRMNASVGWKHAGWNVNLTMLRDGAKPNAAAVRDNGYTMEGDGKLPAFVTYNASVTWLARRNLSLSFVINNVCNTQPSFDRTETYDLPIAFAAYGSYGRSYLLTAQYRFVPGHQ